MLTACMLGQRFAIVTFAGALGHWFRDCVEMHGLQSRCAGIRALDQAFASIAKVQNEKEGLLVTLANRAVEEDRIDVLQQTLLVYPPGAVTLRIPVDVLPGGPSGRADLAFGYMACGPKGCLPPVTDKRVSVIVPEAR